MSNAGNFKSVTRVVKTKKGLRRIYGKAMNYKKYTEVYCVIGLCKGGVPKSKKVHQLVAEAFLSHAPCGHKLVVDHVDNDKSNNRADNLQILSHRENVSKEKRGVSKYVGVSWYKAQSLWQAEIYIKGKSYYLGRYKNELDAAKAYQNKLEKL